MATLVTAASIRSWFQTTDRRRGVASLPAAANIRGPVRDLDISIDLGHDVDDLLLEAHLPLLPQGVDRRCHALGLIVAACSWVILHLAHGGREVIGDLPCRS